MDSVFASGNAIGYATVAARRSETFPAFLAILLSSHDRAVPIFPCHYPVRPLGSQGGSPGADNPVPARHRAPLEMHMVHRNDKYKTMAEALNKTDGILILATLFEVSQSWAESLEHLRLFYVPFRVLH